MSILYFIKNLIFKSSSSYWEKRYREGGNSGAGSFGDKAIYKAAFINSFIDEHNIYSVVELGCGDGNQLKMLDVKRYVGLDVSATVINQCKKIFSEDGTKDFFVLDSSDAELDLKYSAELALSLDVIYHLVENNIYHSYMQQLFNLAHKWVIIYAWNTNDKQKFHVRHRRFSDWVGENRKDFALKLTKSSDKGYCDFYVYERIELNA